MGWVNPDGTLTLLDNFSVQQSRPVLDAQQDVLPLGSTEDAALGTTRIRFSRAFATLDAMMTDFVFTLDPLTVSWAYGKKAIH